MNINVNNISPTQATIEIRGEIGLPSAWQDEEQRDENTASTYEKFQAILATIVEQGVAKLRLNIRSTGGAVQDALLIHGALSELVGVEIETHCYGFVASAATIIAQAASPGARHVASTALYLIHNSSTQIDGNATTAQAAAMLLEKTDEQIATIYALRSNRTIEHFRSLMARGAGQGEWLNAQETIENGLADVVEKMSPIKNAVQNLRSFFLKMFEVDYGDHPEHEPTRAQSPKNTATEVVFAPVEGRPTQTLPKEDPSIENESISLTGNKKSYFQDAELFRD
ncbi:MAG: Clp protease ClpP [Mucinivorans sp.]